MHNECDWFGSEKGKAGKATNLDGRKACRDKGNVADREMYGTERLPEKIQTDWPVALASGTGRIFRTCQWQAGKQLYKDVGQKSI